jgi:uncharacterized membrane protein YcaP (DUF421 family)
LSDFLQILLKSVSAILALFLLARVMGKKQISQLSFFDYVAGITIGSIAASFAVDKRIGYLQGLTGMAVITLFTLALSFASLKSFRARKLLEGKPAILIQHGKILEENLKKSRLSVDDLLEECRLKDVFNIEDVEYAIFETKGELSILLKPQCLPLTPLGMGMQAAGSGVCTNIVVDGCVLRGNLSLLGHDERWLNAELIKLNMKGAESLLLCCVDGNGKLYAFEKNVGESPTPVM